MKKILLISGITCALGIVVGLLVGISITRGKMIPEEHDKIVASLNQFSKDLETEAAYYYANTAYYNGRYFPEAESTKRADEVVGFVAGFLEKSYHKRMGTELFFSSKETEKINQMIKKGENFSLPPQNKEWRIVEIKDFAQTIARENAR